MFRPMEKTARRSRGGHDRPRRPSSLVAAPEAVEGRTLLSSISAITWTSGGVTHSEVYALAVNNTVSASKDGGAFVSLSGYLTAISAGTDASGNPEVFGIGGNDAVWVSDNGGGWTSWSGYVKAIAGSVDNTVFAIGGNNAVYVDKGGTGWTDLGGDFTAISAGTDASGNPEIYALGTNNAVYSDDNGAGWVYRAGYVTSIAASTDNTVFGTDVDHGVWMNRGGTGWTGLGGYARQICAGSDTLGNPEVYTIGANAAAYVSDNGSAFGEIGGYVTDIAGSGMGTLYARGGDVEQVFVSHYALPFSYVSSVALSDPASATGYSPAPSGASLFNGGSPSYLDMVQGVADDCWLDASLAEVADRDPQDIKNMFVYDGTTVDNGSTVGLYSVRYFSPDGVGFYIQVDTALPSGGGEYNRVSTALGTQSLWTALAEKAYAEANALGLVTTNSEYQGSYQSLDFGDPAWALQAITGNAATDYSINPTNIASAWNAGDLIVLTTDTPSSGAIVSSHCYAVVGYNASAGEPFEVFNPWGTQSNGYAPNTGNTIFGLFTANAAFLSQNFDGQSFGTGTGVADDGAGPADVPNGDGYARTATIDLARYSTGGDRPAVAAARPAQGTAAGIDPWVIFGASDGDETTNGLRARRHAWD